MPYWSFGFHLCRYGWTSLNETKQNAVAMRAAGIPLETIWNDINWMRRFRQFQFDETFPPDEFSAFVEDLHNQKQHYIPIVDSGFGVLYNSSDSYYPYERGTELDVWIKNPDGTRYLGKQWPGYAVFPDYFQPNTQSWWTEVFSNFSQVIDFDGIWLDLNEPSSFITGSVENSTVHLNQTQLEPDYRNYPPGVKGGWPEGYDPVYSGTSGNLTLNGTLSYGANGTRPVETNTQLRRAAAMQSLASANDIRSVDFLTRNPPKSNSQFGKIGLVDFPPYPIRNGNGPLGVNTVSPNATTYGGTEVYSVHNLYGAQEIIATNEMSSILRPGQRPFIVARATFAGIGRKTAHWLGDNQSTWASMKTAIQGVLQFNLFAVPMVGPDTCGFSRNTNEELCNRWMQLSAFFPFYRNHNTKWTISQEPYRWDSVRDASILAINARYSLLPFWMSLFSDVAQSGLPPVTALFHEFDDPSLFTNDAQFLVGGTLLVTPVLQPNVSTVAGQFPSQDGVSWRNFFSHELLNTSDNDWATVDAPLGSIPVHVRSGRILLLHAQPKYTTTDTRAGPYAMLVTLDNKGYAESSIKLDDGISLPGEVCFQAEWLT